jgi:hypothetical protein
LPFVYPANIKAQVREARVFYNKMALQGFMHFSRWTSKMTNKKQVQHGESMCKKEKRKYAASLSVEMLFDELVARIVRVKIKKEAKK